MVELHKNILAKREMEEAVNRLQDMGLLPVEIVGLLEIAKQQMIIQIEQRAGRLWKLSVILVRSLVFWLRLLK